MTVVRALSSSYWGHLLATLGDYRTLPTTARLLWQKSAAHEIHAIITHFTMPAESLVATRKRRRNAGLRLKQLIELEEHHDNALPAFPTTEDDENVALLFQEDGEDEEFEDPELKGLDSESDENGDADDADDDDGPQLPKSAPDDEQLSDSELSELDLDLSEGERELQKQEKIAKKRKKTQLIPEIKKRPTTSAPAPKKQPTPQVTLEALMLASRRLSLRSLVVKNTNALVSRLKEDEERRKTMTPVVRPQYRQMTQEERLAEAVETERRNVLALHLFRQQEVVKKEQRRMNMLSRRPPLVDVVRFELKETFITPGEEVEEWRKLHRLLDKFKRKPTRKRQIQEYLDRFKVEPGVLRRDLPHFEPWDGDDGEDDEAEAEDGVIEQTPEHTPEPTPEPTTEAAPDTATEPIEVKTEEPEEMDVDVKPESTDANGDTPQEVKVKVEPKEEEALSLATPKRVTFAEDADVSLEYDLDLDLDLVPKEEDKKVPIHEAYEPLATGELFHGPVQRVARQRVYLYDFEDPRYTETLIKSYVLGPQSTLPASHRFKDLKTIFKSGGRDDYGAAAAKKKIQAEHDALLTLVATWTEEEPMFDRLRKLPRLGIRQEVVDESDDDQGDNGATITITTEAPLGLYLPNNNKKTCMILGKEVRYFDPHLGVPYATVDDLELIKEIERGLIPWYSFAAGTNDTGPIEIYLGHRERSRHAKGVPPGFA